MPLGFALVALASAPLSPQPAAAPAGSAARAEAIVSVRIVQGARLRLNPAGDVPSAQFRSASVQLEDGTRHPARLIEFE